MYSLQISLVDSRNAKHWKDDNIFRSLLRALHLLSFHGFALYQLPQCTFQIILLQYFNIPLQGALGTLCIPKIKLYSSCVKVIVFTRLFFFLTNDGEESCTPELWQGSADFGLNVDMCMCKEEVAAVKMPTFLSPVLSTLYPVMQNREGMGKPLFRCLQPHFPAFSHHSSVIGVKLVVTGPLCVSVYSHQIQCPTQSFPCLLLNIQASYPWVHEFVINSLGTSYSLCTLLSL